MLGYDMMEGKSMQLRTEKEGNSEEGGCVV
jgi:hypothetical protein